jgi:Flp pilus assembly CpaE family ATPase
VDEDPVALRAALRWGMTELLAPPFARAPLAAVVSDLKRERELNPVSISSQNHFCAFVPAKGGVGASTIAANAARAFGSVPDMSVLLADFDLYSGVGGFLFNVEHDFNMSDAAGMSKTLDDDTWERLIHKSGDIDLLLSSGPAAAIDRPIHETQLGRIIDFAHRNYSVICADLPDAFDDRSLLILREATRIFIVTTPELSALRVARLKAMTLQKLDWGDKAALVVNRVTRSMELSLQEIEQTVGLPIFAAFPSEYADVTRAARTGTGAPKLADAARQFAFKLLNKKFEKKRARFIERFALVPAAYSFK